MGAYSEALGVNKAAGVPYHQDCVAGATWDDKGSLTHVHPQTCSTTIQDAHAVMKSKTHF